MCQSLATGDVYYISVCQRLLWGELSRARSRPWPDVQYVSYILQLGFRRKHSLSAFGITIPFQLSTGVCVFILYRWYEIRVTLVSFWKKIGHCQWYSLRQRILDVISSNGTVLDPYGSVQISAHTFCGYARSENEHPPSTFNDTVPCDTL